MPRYSAASKNAMRPRSPPARWPFATGFAARESDDVAAESAARAAMVEANRRAEAVRAETKTALVAADPRAKTKDSDYVFITFILTQLPHGVIGLLVAVMFAAALSSKAAELNALGTTTTIDLWRHFRPARGRGRGAQCARGEMVHGLVGPRRHRRSRSSPAWPKTSSRPSTSSGSIFYGVVLGFFLVAFFFRGVGGSAVFWAAVAAQALVIAMYYVSEHRLPLVQRDRLRRLHRVRACRCRPSWGRERPARWAAPR